jgi:RNA polymerase sigma factor (sigma-70 family)
MTPRRLNNHDHDLKIAYDCFESRGANELDDGPGRNGRQDDGEDPLAAKSLALRAVLRRYFAKHGVGESELDDLVQDVFLRIVHRGGAGRLEQLDGYIFQTAASVLADRWRRRKARQADRHVSFDPDRHGEQSPGPDDALLAREALRATSLSLLELPERVRRVFLLRRVEGLSFQTIARRLGLSVSAVEKDMLRAVRHLMSSQESGR